MADASPRLAPDGPQGLLDINGPITLRITGAKEAKDPVTAAVDLRGDGERPFSVGLVAQVKELAPVLLQHVIKELPRLQAVVPHNYRLGLSLFGVELFAITFTGETRADLRSGG
jgi:hypothetical protein